MKMAYGGLGYSWERHPALNIQNMGEKKHGESRSENDRHL